MSKVLRIALVSLGCLSLALGVAGALLPVLPTTPFLLLAAACFARSSGRLHGWLVRHPRLGPYMEGFVYGGGISASAKRRSVAALWAAIAVSSLLSALGARSATVRIGAPALLALVAGGVTIYILTRPTAGPGDPSGEA